MEQDKIKPIEKAQLPASNHEFHHRLPVQMRFNDIDMLGHLNNSVYIEFMDLGKAHYLKAVMQDKLDWKRVNVVVVNINCDFLAPTYLNEPLEVLTAVVSISNRSFKIEQQIINSQTKEIKCVGRTIMAGFNPLTAEGTVISEDWVNALNAYEHRDLRLKE